MEDIIKWMTQRIKDEHRKHSSSNDNWAEIAARKLFATYDIKRKPNSDNISKQNDMKEMILSEYKKGNIVVSTFEGLQVAPLKEIIKQPIDGLLYDLNRNEMVVLTFINDPKWVNDYAMVQVVRELKKQIELQNK